MKPSIHDILMNRLPLFDAYEDTENGDHLIDIDLPGVQKDDLKIRAEHRQVCIEASRKKAIQPEEHRILNAARWSKLGFSIPTTESMDIENLKANYKDGVLTLRIPKKEAFKKKDIAIDFN